MHVYKPVAKEVMAYGTDIDSQHTFKLCGPTIKTYITNFTDIIM